MSIIDKIKANPFFRTIKYFPKSFLYRKINKQLEKEKNQRIQGKEDERFEKLKRLKDSHKGERCFIVATGPSLSLEDLELIKNDISLSVNSIIKLFDKTDWRPTYFGIQDAFVFDKMKEEIWKTYSDDTNVFLADNLLEIDKEKNSKYILFPYNKMYHEYAMERHKYFCNFSDNAYGMVYDGYSITYSLLQIAVYMGFKNIYLLGCDCSYPKGQKNHIVESGHVDKYEYLNHKRMITGYEKAFEFIKNKDIKIYNCTRGGELEVFERKKLEEVMFDEK